MQWRIYYGDGSTFDSSQGSPLDAPPLDVQIIVVADDQVGRQLLHLWDWYYWDHRDNQWCGADIYGLLDQLLWNHVSAVKQGRTLPQSEFDAIKATALADRDFTPKSGDKKNEARKGQVWGDGRVA